MNDIHTAMGVDIGGTHITAALIDLPTKKIIPGSLKRSSVNAGGTADEILTAWSACIAAVKQKHEVSTICLAMPGPFDYENGISLMRGQDKYESMFGLNIKERLASTLNFPPLSIFTDNDAACFLQGEVVGGAAAAHHEHTVVGITLGTGLGSAVFRGGRSSSADRWCRPFRDGIAEDYLCTRWFVRRWKELTGEKLEGVKEINAIAASNEKARQLFNEFGNHLGQFLLDFISDESPAVVVIGGNIARGWEWFYPALDAVTGGRYTNIEIVQASLGEQAPLLGAVSASLQQRQSLPDTI